MYAHTKYTRPPFNARPGIEASVSVIIITMQRYRYIIVRSKLSKYCCAAVMSFRLVTLSQVILAAAYIYDETDVLL